MLPLWDNIPSERTPFVNYAIIGMCILAFLSQLAAPAGDDQIVREYGMIPIRISHPNEKEVVVEFQSNKGGIRREIVDLSTPISPTLTLVTCMFLHAGLMHIVGNLWVLWIFGDNVEDRFGHVGYALMYLVSGIAAGLMHIATDPNSFIPTIGASGAIAGVMGAYLLLYPKAVVMTLIPFGFFSRLIPIPAPYFLGFWFLLQIFSGATSESGGGGVAWWAHVGGFAAGFGATAALKQLGWLNPPPPETYQIDVAPPSPRPPAENDWFWR